MVSIHQVYCKSAFVVNGYIKCIVLYRICLLLILSRAALEKEEDYSDPGYEKRRRYYRVAC